MHEHGEVKYHSRLKCPTVKFIVTNKSWKNTSSLINSLEDYELHSSYRREVTTTKETATKTILGMWLCEHVILLVNACPSSQFLYSESSHLSKQKAAPPSPTSDSRIATMSAPQQPAAVGRGEEAGSPPTTSVRPQRGSITSLLILSLVFLMMTNNGGGDGLSARDQYKDSLSSLEWQLGNYSAWLNGSDTSNFTLVSGALFFVTFPF